jgi:hypothetical protein
MANANSFGTSRQTGFLKSVRESGKSNPNWNSVEQLPSIIRLKAKKIVPTMPARANWRAS